MNMYMYRGGVWIGLKKIFLKRRYDIYDVFSGCFRFLLFRLNFCYKYLILEIIFYVSVVVSNLSMV